MLDKSLNHHRDRLILVASQILETHPSARPDRLPVSLREAGFSSLDLVRLVLSVEEDFGIALGPDDMDPENFEPLDSREGLVRRLAA